MKIANLPAGHIGQQVRSVAQNLIRLIEAEGAALALGDLASFVPLTSTWTEHGLFLRGELHLSSARVLRVAGEASPAAQGGKWVLTWELKKRGTALS